MTDQLTDDATHVGVLKDSNSVIFNVQISRRIDMIEFLFILQ
jgi:hypothetical protein